jgi:hypothetical protein
LGAEGALEGGRGDFDVDGAGKRGGEEQGEQGRGVEALEERVHGGSFSIRADERAFRSVNRGGNAWIPHLISIKGQMRSFSLVRSDVSGG